VPVKTRKDDGKNARRRALVEAVIDGSKTSAEVAAAENVTVRAVQLWKQAAEAEREAVAPTTVSMTRFTGAPDVTSTNVAPINGNSPEVSVN
jgi:hypothetical protein